MAEINKVSDSALEAVAGGVITEEEALAAALAHAKISRDQVDFIKKIQMDWEHGRKIFEVEFFMNGFEYEFDIDAETGEILKYKRERD